MPTASSYSKNRQEPPIQPLFIGLNPKPSRMRWLLIIIYKKSSDFLVRIIQPFFFFRNSWIFLIYFVFSQWCLHFFVRKSRWQWNYSKNILIIPIRKAELFTYLVGILQAFLRILLSFTFSLRILEEYLIFWKSYTFLSSKLDGSYSSWTILVKFRYSEKATKFEKNLPRKIWRY